MDKIRDAHVVAELGGGDSLMHVTRHLMRVGDGVPLQRLTARGLKVRSPELTFATLDHTVITEPGRAPATASAFAARLAPVRARAAAAAIRLFDIGEPGQGIVHVIGPKLGLGLPGSLIVCCDSHTCTDGGLGAVAFAIGASEVLHVLATQCLVQRKPRRMRVRFEGRRAGGVTAKDMILHLIGPIAPLAAWATPSSHGACDRAARRALPGRGQGPSRRSRGPVRTGRGAARRHGAIGVPAMGRRTPCAPPSS